MPIEIILTVHVIYLVSYAGWAVTKLQLLQQEVCNYSGENRKILSKEVQDHSFNMCTINIHYMW